MSFANTNYSEVLATTIENRSGELADNVLKHTPLLAKLEMKGNVRPWSGGSTILEEIMFQENSNAAWYSGYDQLAVAAADVISAASYTIKQLACAVVISGLEMLQNAGKERIIDLLEGRIKVAEKTMMNKLAEGVYADGTGAGGKQLAGLGALVVASPSTGVVGGIDRATWNFWRNYATGSLGALTATTIQAKMNLAYSNLVRGKEHPDLVIFPNDLWGYYMGSLQSIQRFTDPKMADLGFTTVKYMNSDVVLDQGINGFATSAVGYFLNTDYIFLRPHSQRNMTVLSPNRRVSINQDAEVQIIAWAGAMTMSGGQFQGYFQAS